VAPAPASAPTPRVRAKNAPLVAISTPPPEFPERARRMRISGYVVVTYTIGTDGRVGNVRIVESQPRGVFEREVESTLARWRYEPLAAPREITHTFDFDQ
jgi:protein TonB